ncbi:MAG TPA: lysine-sensitive aspartokinase 3 [Bacteroidota bacterium]|nr:lysine-sensitive aspartokinase 3 [Bacteroidota bacterium]
MIVMKFGGTSVEDVPAIRRVIEIVQSHRSRKPLVVVSACAGVTNDLIRVAQTVKNRDENTSLSILDQILEQHTKIVDGLMRGNRQRRIKECIETMFQELRNLIRGVYLLGELTSRSLDTFMSYGERLSSLIVQHALEEIELPSVLIDARQVMITGSTFGAAQPLMDKITERAKNIFKPMIEAGKVIVTQGFIGATDEGTTTTIGRGGSDYSASIFGSAVDAEEIQIWTDVDGMMTADPRIVPHAKRIDVLSFDEASELAYFGAKVLHPNTILPAVRRNIPVRVLHARRPELEGTLILKSPPATGNPVKSIASKKGIVLINVTSSRMLLAHGFLAKLFSIFAEHQKSVDVVSTSEVSVSLTVDSEVGLAEVQKELEQIGEVHIEPHKAIVCVVGERMKQTPGIAARVFNALAQANVNIEMISEGASEINITMVVDDKDVNTSVRVLHDEFFPKE